MSRKVRSVGITLKKLGIEFDLNIKMSPALTKNTKKYPYIHIRQQYKNTKTVIRDVHNKFFKSFDSFLKSQVKTIVSVL